MKFKYKYIVYKVYSWTANNKNDTPIANTIITLGIVHFFQLFTVLLFVDRVIVPLKWMDNINKIYLGIGGIAYFFLLYFILYNKSRWELYMSEFGNESESEKKRGNIFVITFLVGSILLFFLSLPILFSICRWK